MANNINKLQQTTNTLNDVKNVSDSQFNDVNLTYGLTDTQKKTIRQQAYENLSESTLETREEALQNEIAGIPIIDTPTINVATHKADLSETPVTSSFTTRDEIMSNLGLMDENYSYTDTYTNYINSGGTPLQGYAHTELLAQERYDQIFEQVEEGTISYDDALLKAYGDDILEAMGYNVRSVAYWQNKFENNDFTTPYTNRYIMDQVIDAAESYHQQRLAGEYGQTEAKDTQLASVVGQEVEYTQIKDLFPFFEDFKESLTDDEFEKALSLGQISASVRLTQDDDGTYYYLHTDGKVYKLDGETGDGHGTLVMKNGEIEAIDLNGSGVWTAGRSTLVGFDNVFVGIGEVGATLAQSLYSICTLGYGTDGDWGIQSMDEILGWANKLDAWLHDDVSWLVDNGYVDMSSDITAQDVANFTGSMIGTIAGTMALAIITSGLSETAQAAKAAGHPIEAFFEKGTSDLLRWQTGNLGSASDAATSAGIWGRRIAASAVNNTKNWANDYRKMVAQATLYEDGATTSDIFSRTFCVNAINFGVDCLISGGLDDNQLQAYKSLFNKDEMSKAAQTALAKEMEELIQKSTSKELLDQLKENTELKKYLRSKVFTITCNSVADFIGNITTGYVSSNCELDEEGYVKEWQKPTLNAELAARSLINTLWYSTRSQIKEWNAGLESIGKVHQEWLEDLNTKIAKEKDPKNVETLVKIKAEYLETISKSEVPSEEGKILEGMDKLCESLGKIPKDLAKIFKKNKNEKVRDYCKQLYEDGIIMYGYKTTRIATLANPEIDKSTLFQKILYPFKSFPRFVTGTSGAQKAFKNEQAKQENQIVQEQATSEYNILSKSLDIIKQTEDLKQYTKDLEPITQTYVGSDLPKDIKEDINAKRNETYIVLNNGGERPKEYDIASKALEVLDELGYAKRVSDTRLVYQLQPYYDGFDFINTSVITSHIFKTVQTLAVTTDAELQCKLVSDMLDNISTENTSMATKSAIVGRFLYKLCEDNSSNGSSKALLTYSEASAILIKLKDSGKVIITENSATSLQTLNKIGDVLLKIQKGHAKLLDLSDTETREALEILSKENKEIKNIYKDIIKLQKENPEAFLDGSLSSRERFIINNLDEAFKDMLPKDTPVSLLVEEDIESYIKALGKGKAFKEIEGMVKQIKSLSKKFDDLQRNTKTVTIDNDGKVYIDLTMFRGKKTNEFTEKFLRAKTQIRHAEDQKWSKQYESDLYKEFKALNKYSLQGSSIITFDIEDPELKNFFSEFGYNIIGKTKQDIQTSIGEIQGVKNFFGNTIVLDLPVANKADIKELQKLLQTDSVITYDGKRFKLNDKVYLNIRQKALGRADTENDILNIVELSGIPEGVTLQLRTIPLLQLVPFIPDKNGKYNFTEAFSSLLVGKETNLAKQSGKAASQTAQQLNGILLNSIGSKQKIDSNLSNYFILQHLASNMLSMNQGIKLGEEEEQYIKDKQWADSYHKKYDDTVWEIKNHHLFLKTEFLSDDGFKKLQKYIVSENFNVYKLLPVRIHMSDESTQGIIDAFTTYETEGLQETLPGFARHCGFSVLNTRIPWDDKNNYQYAKFLDELIEHNEEDSYNPIQGSKYTINDDATYETYDEWYKATKKSTDPYDILLHRYMDTLNKMAHQGEGSGENLLVFSKQCRKALLEELYKGNTEATEELVKTIKDYLITPSGQTYYYNSSENTIDAAQYRTLNTDDNTLNVSAKSLATSVGGDVTVDNVDWVTLDVVQKAIDLISDIKMNSENEYRQDYFNNYIDIQFQEDNATKLLKSYLGSGGNILVEDVDHIANLLAENYKKWSEEEDAKMELKLNKDMIPVLKTLWGKDYMKNVDVIFKKAQSIKSVYTFTNKQFKGKVEATHYTTPNSPSIKDTSYNTIDKKYGQNRSRFEEYLENAMNMKRIKDDTSFQSVYDQMEHYMSDDVIDSFRRRMKNDQALYMSSPYNSETQKLSVRHNTVGLMFTAIRTKRELVDNLKMSEKDAMDLAIKMTNTNVGAEYSGATAKYFVIKNGKLYNEKDNKGLISSNFKDLFYNIYDKNLKNSTIVEVQKQGINNTAALKLRYIDTNNTEQFEKFSQNLYQNFILANQYKLTRNDEALTRLMLDSSLDTEQAQLLFKNVPSYTLSDIQALRREYSVYKARTGREKITLEEFAGAVKGPSTINASQLTRDAIKQILDDPDNAYDEDVGNIKSVDSLIFTLGDTDYLTDRQRNKINKVKDNYIKLINKDETIPESIKAYLREEIESNDKPEFLNYLLTQRSLEEMRKEVESEDVGGQFLLNMDNNKPLLSNSKPLVDLVKSIINNSENTSPYKTIITYDTETTLTKNASEYNQGVFEIGLNIHRYIDGKWTEEHQDIYVNYSESNETDVINDAISKWVKQNAPESDNFVKTNEGYKEARDNYLNILKVKNDKDILFLKPKEIESYIASLIGTKEDTLLVGYNSTKADNIWMQKSGLLNDTMLSNVTHIDLKTLSDSSLLKDLMLKGKLTERANMFNIDNSKGHMGANDAKVTFELLLQVVANNYSISKVRNRFYNSFKADLNENFKGTTYEFNDDSMNNLFNKLDKLKQDATANQNLDRYFDTNVEINSSTITAATELMTYAINKRLVNTSFALQEQMMRDNYLSDIAVKSLEDNSYLKINNIWGYAEAKGISKEQIVNALVKECRSIDGDISVNNILEVLSSPFHTDNVLEYVGLNYKDYEKAEEISKNFIEGNPEKDPAFNNVDFKKYRALKDDRTLALGLKNIISSIGYSDENELLKMATELSTFYDFNKDINPSEVIENNSKFIETKTYKPYKEYLENNYSSVDGLVHTKKNGAYNLVSSFGIGNEIQDAISGEKVITDESMCIVSRNEFSSLVGMSVEEYLRLHPEYKTNGLYSDILINPADANNKILPRRIIINAKANGMILQVPETVIETLGARDFDGDHLVLLRPDDYTQEILKIYSDNAFKVHAIQENFLNILRVHGVTSNEYNVIYNIIGRDENIINLCKEADNLLSIYKNKSNEEIDELFNKKVDGMSLNDRFEEEVNRIINKHNASLETDKLKDRINLTSKLLKEIKKSIWLQQKDLYEDTRKTETYRFINNPATQTEVSGRKSYSAEQKQRAEINQVISKDSYAFIDQSTGMEEKYHLFNQKNKIINNPWTDLITNGIYASNTVAKYIDNLRPEDADVVDELYNVYSYAFPKFSKENLQSNLIIPMKQAIKKGYNGRATALYNTFLQTVEQEYRKSLEPTDLYNALTSETIKQKYEENKKNLQIARKNVQLYNDLKRNSVYFPSDDKLYGNVTEYLMSNLINEFADKSSNQINAFTRSSRANGFIITSFKDATEGNKTVGISEDEILYNKNSNNKWYGYERSIIQLGKNEKINPDLEEGVWYKHDTKLTDSKQAPKKLFAGSKIVSITDKTITIERYTHIDGKFKIVTNYGGKGTVNATYGTDDNIDFIINNPNPSKIFAAFDIEPQKEEPKLEQITLKDDNGNDIVVTGYRATVIPKVVEDTTTWKTDDKEYNIGSLTYIMGAQSLEGFTELGLGKINEQGELEVGIEELADIAKDIYKNYNYIQTHNAFGTFNKAKVAYVLNRITDEQLQQVFNTNMSANELRGRLLNNKFICTENYMNIAYTLGKMLKEGKFKGASIDDEIGKKLFDDDMYRFIGKYTATAGNAKNTSNITGKRSANAMANITKDGKSKLAYSSVQPINLDVDLINLNKNLVNFEDYYMSGFDLIHKLTGNRPNSFTISQMLRDNKLPYGTFIKGTATTDNSFRNYNTRFTIEDDSHVYAKINDSEKTGLVKDKAYNREVTPKQVDLVEPSKDGEDLNLNYNGGREFMNLLIDSSVTSDDLKYANTTKPKVINILNMLSKIPKGETIAKKKELVGYNNTYNILDSRFLIYMDDEGRPTLSLPKNVVATGTLNDLMKETRNSLNTYSYYNIHELPEEDKSSYIDASKTPKVKSIVNKKPAEEIYNRLNHDIYDDLTGEVKKVEDMKQFKSSEDALQPAKVLANKGETNLIKESVWGRQGIDESTPLGARISAAMKNGYATAAFFEQEYIKPFNAFYDEATKWMSNEDLENYCALHAIRDSWNIDHDEKLLQSSLAYHNKTSLTQVENELKSYQMKYSQIEVKYTNWLNTLIEANKLVAKDLNEPLGRILMAEIAPYNTKNKEYNKQRVMSTIKGIAGITKYNPALETTEQSKSLEFDLVNSSKSIIKELAQLSGVLEISKALEENKIIENASLLNNMDSLLNKAMVNAEDDWVKNDNQFIELESRTLNEIKKLTNLNLNLGKYVSSGKQYKQIYDAVGNRLSILIEDFHTKYGMDNVKTYTDFKFLSENESALYDVKEQAKVISNFYYAKMLCGQSMIQASPKFANDVGSYLTELKTKGFCLVNKYGQKIEKGTTLKPISTTSTQHILPNMEIAYNSHNETMWNQFVFEKIISGELYLMDSKTADIIEKNYYTTDVGSEFTKELKKISKWSAALQMALPSKILNRVISFTGFDYSMGILYDPKVITNISRARKEIIAAYQSKGNNISDELKQYLIREGQPIGLTGKDPVTFSEDLSGPDTIMKVLNTMTDPLEIQNHLGRYAIYLTALEGFNEGKPNYGPVYYAKNAIDSLPTNEDKAMYIMDYVLGSPGGFPKLSQKTSGYMLYATFPMNFARTMGAWGMSLGKLFSEGFNSENSTAWMKTAMVPSMGLAGITGASMLLTAFICDLLGVKDEEKEELVKDLSTIDIVGTMIGGTPTKSGSSMNPLENAYSMTLEPFFNSYNETTLEKIFGVVNTNITSHLNPALKIPLEMVTGYDVYGSSLMSTKNTYTNIENGIRKVLGTIIGSNVANSLVDQFKFDKYNSKSFTESVTKGITNGISASLGNQKSYKRDITNYYNVLTDINNYYYKSNDYYDDDIDSIVNSDKMSSYRNYYSEYGEYDKDDYKRVYNIIKKMIRSKQESTSVYSEIVGEYKNGVSEATLRAVLNSISIVRKLNSIDKEAYLNTLSTSEYKNLIKAITYENEFYPLLQEMFPNSDSSSSSGSSYIEPYSKTYYNSGSGSSYISTPKVYYPTLSGSSSYSKKYYNNNNYTDFYADTVSVSPQMGVWDEDYNEIEDLDKNIFYINNPYYNNLSDYEKREKIS